MIHTVPYSIWHVFAVPNKKIKRKRDFRVTTSSPCRLHQLHQSHPLIRCLRCLSTTQQDLHGHTSLGNNLQLGSSVCIYNHIISYTYIIGVLRCFWFLWLFMIVYDCLWCFMMLFVWCILWHFMMFVDVLVVAELLVEAQMYPGFLEGGFAMLHRGIRILIWATGWWFQNVSNTCCCLFCYCLMIPVAILFSAQPSGCSASNVSTGGRTRRDTSLRYWATKQPMINSPSWTGYGSLDNPQVGMWWFCCLLEEKTEQKKWDAG